VRDGCHQTGGYVCLSWARGRPHPRVLAPTLTQAYQPCRARVPSQSGKGGGAQPDLSLAASGPLALSPTAARARAGDALAALDAADALDPDLPELWTARCRVLKHAGDLAGAAAAAVRAQGMDLSDRRAPGQTLLQGFKGFLRPRAACVGRGHNHIKDAKMRAAAQM
jgi:hypothetical protein